MLENIRDRGTKKWTAMMLPEHVEELNKWMDMDHYEDRPELSEWELQAMQVEIEVAFKSKCQTLIKTWNNGKKMTRGGIIEVHDLRSKSIVLENPFGTERIQMADIIGVQCEV